MTQAISTAAQCRMLDAEAIAKGVPGIALMEIASQAVARVVRDHYEGARVLVLCGGGNNGGDGYGAARWLKLHGFDVAVESFATESRGDAAVMRAAAAAHGVPEASPGFRPDLVVDAIFGTGLTRTVEGRAAERLRELEGTTSVAVDLPSGLHADTGALLGPVLDAAHTVTFGRLKQAFYTRGGASCGEVHAVDIGVHPAAHRSALLLTATGLVLPERPARAYKNRLGHLAIVAGSIEMAGAAHLATLGALAVSPGLITLFTPPGALSRLGALPPEVMVRPLDASTALADLQSYDAVAIGPGLGGGRALEASLVELVGALVRSEQPVVADADALLPMPVGSNVVRTPHSGEAGRLLGWTAAGVEADRFAASAALDGCSVLKGPHSLIHDGEQAAVSPFCTSVLATAGSGDVLTGLIGGLLARGVPLFEAACSGVYLHGSAGMALEGQHAEGWRASAIAAAARQVFAELT